MSSLDTTVSRPAAWPWAIAFILLTVRFRYILTDDVDLSYNISWLIPFLAAYLGVRYGRRALAPILIAAPILLLSVEFDEFLGERLTVAAGLNVAMFALAVATALAFAAPEPTSPGATLSTKHSRAAIAVFVLILYLLSFSVTVSLETYDGNAWAGVAPFRDWAFPALAFWMAASGRLSLRGLIVGLVVFSAIVSLTRSLLFIADIGQNNGWIAQPWIAAANFYWDGLRYEAERMIANEPAFMYADLDWSPSRIFAVPFALAAGFAGLALEPAWRARRLPAPTPRTRQLLHAAAITAVFGALAFSLASDGMNLTGEAVWNAMSTVEAVGPNP